MIGACIARDAEHPRAEDYVVPERRAVLEHSHENILHKVLRRLPVTRDPQAEPVKPCMVTLEERGERTSAPAAHLAHQFRVTVNAHRSDSS
jgi:hypothetical protein